MDFIDPFLPFTSYVLAIAFISALLAPSVDFYLLGVGELALFLGLYGSHYSDLIEGGYRTTPERLEKVIAATALSLAVGLGIFLAFVTTFWFLTLVLVGSFIAVSYNLELFGGRLHDTDRLGYLAFGTAWGFIPSFGISVIMDNLTVSALFLALAFGILSVSILMIFEATKPVPHRKNPLVDNPPDTAATANPKEVAYRALLLITIALWTFVVSGVLDHFGL